MTAQQLHQKYDWMTACIESTALVGKIPWDVQAGQLICQTRVRFPYILLYPQGIRRTKGTQPGKRGKIISKPLCRLHYTEVDKATFVSYIFT